MEKQARTPFASRRVLLGIIAIAAAIVAAIWSLNLFGRSGELRCGAPGLPLCDTSKWYIDKAPGPQTPEEKAKALENMKLERSRDYEQKIKEEEENRRKILVN